MLRECGVEALFNQSTENVGRYRPASLHVLRADFEQSQRVVNCRSLQSPEL